MKRTAILISFILVYCMGTCKKTEQRILLTEHNTLYVAQLQPEFAAKTTLFLQAAKRRGFEVYLTDAYRTPARQNAYYAQGRTVPGAIITNARGGASLHQARLAFDCCILVNGKKQAPTEELGKLAAKYGIFWLGFVKNLGFEDKWHFQISNFKLL